MLAFGDVLNLRDDVERMPVIVAHQRGAQERPDHLAVFVEVALFVFERIDFAIDELPAQAQILGQISRDE